MKRRSFLASAALGAAATATVPRAARAALPKMQITTVQVLSPPNPNPLSTQADMVVKIEPRAGITGLGEGGAKDQWWMGCSSPGKRIARRSDPYP